MPLISPNFDFKSIIFPHFGQGPFPKIAEKALHYKGTALYVVYHKYLDLLTLILVSLNRVHTGKFV